MQSALNLSSEIAKANEIRMAVTYSFIVGSYIVCWAPLVGIFTFIFWTGNINHFQGTWNMQAIQYFTLCTSHFNPAINPFIYAYRIRDVRDTMKRFLRIKTSNEPSAVDDDEWQLSQWVYANRYVTGLSFHETVSFDSQLVGNKRHSLSCGQSWYT